MFTQYDHHHFAQIDSTNTWAKQNVATFNPEKITVITADTQSAGRGRFDRKWSSPAGQNIYATFCFCLEHPTTPFSNLSIVLGITAAQILIKYGFDPKLKWPNDLIVNKKKVGGILCETTALNKKLWLFLGMGININMPLTDLMQIDQPATSLFAEKKQKFELEEILFLLQNQFLKNLNLYLNKNFIPFLPKYRELLIYKKDQKIYCKLPHKTIEGYFDSIDYNGALIMRLDNGLFQTITSGEVL